MSDRRSKRPYASHKGDACEWCGFNQGIPEQFDVDHKNERHDDNRLENLQTLCARCHRLKSWLVRQQIPETEWLELRSRYGATVTEVIIDVSKRSS